VRETAGIDTALDADAQDDPTTEGATAGFTPIFSRRATGHATQDASPAADAEPEAATGEPAPMSPAQPESEGHAAADDRPETSADEMPATGTVHDAALLEPEAEDLGDDGADTEPGMAGIDTVAFSSVRETDADPSAEIPSTGPDQIDTAALLDDLPQHADTPDEGESAASGARLTVVVGKGDSADSDPASSASPPDDAEAISAGAAEDLRSIDTRILEEEVLRRIVAEAVREELQGALGERITRNVRKLVRREIRLVLAVDELD